MLQTVLGGATILALAGLGAFLTFALAVDVLGWTDARVHLLTCAGAVLGMGCGVELVEAPNP